MPIDLQIVESLLHEPEGTTLDFKQQQYPFENASPAQKAELLKDILAFTNSWRRTAAYILIGVKEVKGGRSEVVGVEYHLDDATLHQFVNSKTQRPIDFSYVPLATEGAEIGVIEIPKQERPIYLTHRFDRLAENVVWTRDGSSTRIATPDEVARMGAEQVGVGSPQLTLEWAGIKEREALTSSCRLQCLCLSPVLSPTDIRGSRSPRLGFASQMNWRYRNELIKYVAEVVFFTGLGFRLKNDSGIVGQRVCFTGRIKKSGGAIVREWIEDVPSPTPFFGLSSFSPIIRRDDNSVDIAVKDLIDYWEITIEFGDIRPREVVWTNESIFVGSTSSGSIILVGELLGDNLPDPIQCDLELQVEVEHRAMTLADVLPYWADH